MRESNDKYNTLPRKVFLALIGNPTLYMVAVFSNPVFSDSFIRIFLLKKEYLIDLNPASFILLS